MMRRSAALLCLLATSVALCAWVPTPSVGLITHGPRGLRELALTFDADMTRAMLLELEKHRVARWYDSGLLAELGRTRTPATIFVTGLFAIAYPRLVRMLARDPLVEIANHTYDHAAWEGPCYGLPLVRALKRSELERTASVLARLTGRRPRYFRFPGGCQNEADVRLVRSLGEVPVQWDVVSGDAYLRDPVRVERQVLQQVRPGSIVVFHLNGAPVAPATAAAVTALIPALQARGFRLVTVGRLLGTATSTHDAEPSLSGRARPRERGLWPDFYG
jgi:peptidoglycan-N-acetylglucosamine deacetylase